MYQLYYYPRNASFAPHWVLEELGLTFELVLVDRAVNAQKDDAYKALNPAGRIPTLVDGDNVIFESAAICLHLCENNPDNTLTPEFGDPSRANFFQWLFYLTTTVQSELMVYLYPEKHTIDSQSASAVAMAQEQRLHDMFQLLDQQLEHKKYLVNDTFTLCDCFLFMLSMWASKLTRPPMSFSNLARYLDNLTQRSALARVAKKEGVDLSLFRL